MKEKLNIFGQVRDLQRTASIGFCAVLLERQIVNFELFCSLNECEGNEQMRKALNQIWLAFESTQQRKKFTTNISLLRDKVEVITPDASDYDNFGVYPAIDCAMAMVATLNLIDREDDTGAVVVSKLSQGTVEAVILATEGELENQAIKQHPLMQREIDFQIQVLTALQYQSTDSKSLKTLALEDGASNIGIELN
jgi:hypothetical protein